MTQILDTPDGPYVVYHRANAGLPEAHRGGTWYFQPADYTGGDVYSKGYASRDAASAAAWDWAQQQAASALEAAAPTAYLAKIGRKGGASGRGQSKVRSSANVAGAVRQVLARVRCEARAEGASYDAGCGAHPLPDGRDVEVRLAASSDGGLLLGVREYRVTRNGDGRWRRV